MLSELSVEILSLPILEFFQFAFLSCIGELFLNEIQFLLIKNVNAFIYTIKPRVIQTFISSQSFIWILLKHFNHQVSCFFGSCVFKLYLGVEDHFIQISHLVGFEGNIAIEHSVEADSCTPDVHWETFVS